MEVLTRFLSCAQHFGGITYDLTSWPVTEVTPNLCAFALALATMRCEKLEGLEMWGAVR
jgi:hypothetical protein